MKTKNNGGTMTTTILFGMSFVLLVAAIVVYLMKDDTTTKLWADHTKKITEHNEKLAAEWQEAITMVKAVCTNHESLAVELTRQAKEIDKIEFALNKPSVLNGAVHLKIDKPLTVEFNPITVRHVKGVKKKTASKTAPLKAKNATTKNVKALMNGAAKPTAAQKRLLKKTSKQMKQLSQ